MICDACNENVHPVQEMRANGRGFQTKCPRLECGSPMPEIEHIEVMAPKEAPVPTPAMVAVAEVTRAFDEHVRLPPTRVPISDAPNDLVAMSRARLSEIELRLSEHDRLQTEARRLRAMIAAAEATESN